MNPAENSSEKITTTVKHSMVKKEVLKKLSGQEISNGGCGVLEHPGEKLQELGITKKIFHGKLYPS